MVSGIKLFRVLVAMLLASRSIHAGAPQAPRFSPYAGTDAPTRVYWGDTHLHTSYSVDAGAYGNVRIDPGEAFRFARGETITAHNGMPAKLNQPLDFLVVSDHAEFLGVMPLLRDNDPVLSSTRLAKTWMPRLSVPDPDERSSAGIAFVRAIMFEKDTENINGLARVVAWKKSVEAAERNNEPGVFTAFAGFEWTSMVDGNNLHRVVFFRDNADRLLQVVPFSRLDSDDPAALWRYLDDYARKTGGSALAIPHNSNLSNGLMFTPNAFDGTPMDAAYAAQRARSEPVMEVTQIKGDSESHPYLSPNDEFAGFETWDKGNIAATAAKQPGMLQYEYARSALKLGLKLGRALGVNPYAFGMIGSSDAHTGLSAVEEDNFWGKMTTGEPRPYRARGELIASPLGPNLNWMNWQQAAAGYAAVWASANTREAIFDAMRRREVYATTGTRITVRFFGGWNFQTGDAFAPHLALTGYRNGVPMGSVLEARERLDAVPGFLIAAMRDPEGANLDRVQIVKGWLDATGETHERVYDVALSGGRKPDRKGRVPGVGDTVDVANASFSNSIGAAELLSVWKDPEFNASEPAFYYVRVIEIPTPRWTAYDAKRFRVALDKGVPMKVQERAYTSPIWYNPEH